MDDALNHCDVSPVLQASNDAVLSGASGTNVNDLKLLLGS
jgi:glycerate-2-kinase